MSLKINLANRRWLAERLRAEIVGPDPSGKPCDLNLSTQSAKLTWEEFRVAKRQLNGEEIVWQDPPAKRYGAGILYPIGVEDALEQARSGDDADPLAPEIGTEPIEVDERIEKRLERVASKGKVDLEESDDFAVSLANAHKPSAMGISFLADLSIERAGFKVEIANTSRYGEADVAVGASARYARLSVSVGDGQAIASTRSIYLRTQLLDAAGKYPALLFSADELRSARVPIRRRLGAPADQFEVIVVVRDPHAGATNDLKLVTVSLVNRHAANGGAIDEFCLFQSGIRVSGLSGTPWIAPYREVMARKASANLTMTDEFINKLIYRNSQTFAVGHGCSADWEGTAIQKASSIWTDVMPAFETPSTSADLVVRGPDGKIRQVRVSMRKLAGLDASDDGMSELQELVEAYAHWIEALKSDREGVVPVPADLAATAKGLVERCASCLSRIKEGIALLRDQSPETSHLREAFRLSNHAMLIAQLRTTRDVRLPTKGSDGKMVWTPALTNPNPTVPDEKRGYWRAFQIAFLLMSLKGITDPDDSSREVVDLIWFPTGGGKTEAYLGLTAFTILYNRLGGRDSTGADVLMRYTLRLLTAQQFQRASLLFCAMEHLRRGRPDLGDRPFRIGLWVGGATSPNSRKEAVFALEGLQRDADSENPFVLLKCPWCGAKFGPSSQDGYSGHSGEKGRGRKSREAEGVPKVLGYQKYTVANDQPPTVVYRCNDGACEFGTPTGFSGPKPPLPIVVIDEDIVDSPPNLVIGTVDKFAMLAWKPEIRSLFGIGDDGRHVRYPPTLIIQDELHLISGPLGSMVGAYETIFERLCQANGVCGTKPKIIASTATISRASEQILHLYARKEVFIFPPSGLEAGDSFFSREARGDDGALKPGRLYIGVLAPSHGSLQTTQARTFASLMQHGAIMDASDDARDPWWTLLCFFNSLRELGGAASLFVADTRDYLRVILDRHGIEHKLIRKLFEVTELTSRIRSDQVPKELERLEKAYVAKDERGGEPDAVDACLASNIIEVGVDVSRLSLMAIVGQPKTTSQYIQVSSRVGRDPEKPGLVAVLYGPSKPRDRSHYERFRTYHQKLYAQVEPTSVTPFSPPAVDRALHGVIVAAVRQLGEMRTAASTPVPFPLAEGSDLRDLVEELIDLRCTTVDPDERNSVMERFRRRLSEWQAWQPSKYGSFGPPPEDAPLIHPAGITRLQAWENKSWPTMSSLRNVDASCEAEVTQFFTQVEDGHP